MKTFLLKEPTYIINPSPLDRVNNYLRDIEIQRIICRTNMQLFRFDWLSTGKLKTNFGLPDSTFTENYLMNLVLEIVAKYIRKEIKKINKQYTLEELAEPKVRSLVESIKNLHITIVKNKITIRTKSDELKTYISNEMKDSDVELHFRTNVEKNVRLVL